MLQNICRTVLAETIPERIRNRLSPEVIISTNDNTPDRPFFQPPDIAEIFIYSHGNIWRIGIAIGLEFYFTTLNMKRFRTQEVNRRQEINLMSSTMSSIWVFRYAMAPDAMRSLLASSSKVKILWPFSSDLRTVVQTFPLKVLIMMLPGHWMEAIKPIPGYCKMSRFPAAAIGAGLSLIHISEPTRPY